MIRLSAFCSHLVEFGWLLVLASIPLYFNLNTTQYFEPDKVSLFRAIVTVMAIAWLIKKSVGGSVDRQVDQTDADESIIDDDGDEPTWRRWLRGSPVEAALIVFALAQIVATIGSVEPILSFKGTYYRAQGVMTLLAWVTFALIVAAEVRTSAQLERLTTTMLVTSVPVAWYGILQQFWRDPAGLGSLAYGRASSSIGNPIWFGAFLVMVTPIAAWRLARAIRDWRFPSSQTLRLAKLETKSWSLVALGLLAPLIWTWIYLNYIGWSVNKFGHWWAFAGLLAIGAWLAIFLAPIGRRIRPELRVAGFAGVLLLNLGALVLAASRGPAVGLAAALLALAIIAGARWRRPIIWRSALAVTVLGGVLVVLVNLPNSPLGALRAIPIAGRLLAFQTEGQLPASGRFLIWKGAFDLIVTPIEFEGNGLEVTPAARPLIGYGPDTFIDVFQRTEPAELANSTSRNTVFDRAHSQFIDILVQSGLFGLAAYLAFIIAAVWVGVRALWQTTDTDRSIFLLALTSGVIGHAVEAQSGLQNMPTETYFAACLALLAAAGHATSLATTVSVEPAREREPSIPEATPPRAVAAVAAGVAGRRATAVTLATRRAPTPGDGLVLGMWPGDRVLWGAMGLALVVLGLGFLTFIDLSRQFWIAPAVSLGMLGVIMLFGAAVLAAGAGPWRRVGATLAPNTAYWWPGLLVAALLTPSLMYWNIVPIGADVLYRRAVERQNSVDLLPANDVVNRGMRQLQALVAYRDVLRVLPVEDFYLFALGSAFLQMSYLRQGVAPVLDFDLTWGEVMETPEGNFASAGKIEMARAGEVVFTQAIVLRPGSSEYYNNRARFYVAAIGAIGDQTYAGAALSDYEQSVRLWPSNSLYRAGLADLYGAFGRYDDVLREADEIYARDPVYWRGHMSRSVALDKQDKSCDALASALIAQANLGRSYDVANATEAQAVNTHVEDLRKKCQ